MRRGRSDSKFKFKGRTLLLHSFGCRLNFLKRRTFVNRGVLILHPKVWAKSVRFCNMKENRITFMKINPHIGELLKQGQKPLENLSHLSTVFQEDESD